MVHLCLITTPEKLTGAMQMEQRGSMADHWGNQPTKLPESTKGVLGHLGNLVGYLGQRKYKKQRGTCSRGNGKKNRRAWVDQWGIRGNNKGTCTFLT